MGKKYIIILKILRNELIQQNDNYDENNFTLRTKFEITSW